MCVWLCEFVYLLKRKISLWLTRLAASFWESGIFWVGENGPGIFCFYEVHDKVYYNNQTFGYFSFSFTCKSIGI